MKNIIIMLTLAICLTSCALLQQAKTDAEACWEDPICQQQAVDKAENLKNQINAIGGAVNPFPFTTPIAAGVGGGIALLAFLIAGGRKKREDK